MSAAVAPPSGVAQIPVTRLKGVGPKLAERLQRLDIATVQDLLFHLPLRYQDRTHIVPIGSLRPGDQAVIEGTVELADVRYGRTRMLLCRLSDGTGGIILRFFHFSAAQQAGLARGVRLRCFGEVRGGGANMLEMIHPEYHRINAALAEADPDFETPATEQLTPIYPATEGMQQTSLRALSAQALSLLSAGTVTLTEWLPAALLDKLRLPPLKEAIAYVHYPPPDAPLELLEQGRHPAQIRLAFEELLAHHLSLRLLRDQAQRQSAPALEAPGKLMAALLCALPFTLTQAQQRVIGEIRNDLRCNTPMQRLVQGDVGSGKTLVAACAILHAIEAGYQTVVMAPTELLAEQHLLNFKQWLTPCGIEVDSLTGKLKGKAREALLQRLAGGEIKLAVGTHALFQEGVNFARLGLVVIDEQHRFGVHQRLALREKGAAEGRYPHQLIMTATPIPRTLSMTAYADLDISIIDELPPGRTPVETVVIPDSRRAEVVLRARNACREGRQAYWVCTLIEESEILQCQAASDTALKLADALPELRVGLVHGRLKTAEKEQVMQAFKAGAIDLLVATTVIEVGVDVPNASLMIIENADRLGLAQLHQLRGRVGRGSAVSHCVLLYHSPISEQARARLAVLRASTDGFEIARRDLELRGPGEVLGTRQTGMLQLHIADLVRDQHLVSNVEQAGALLLADYPAHVPPLIQRWLGNATKYGEV